MIRFTARHMNGAGNGHEHIEQLRWTNVTDASTGASDVRHTLVDWLKQNPGQAVVEDGAGNRVLVGVVNASPPYLRTYADKEWTDNLLALPTF